LPSRCGTAALVWFSRVVDMGTGTGMLAIASALMGAAHVVGVDRDEDALALAASNLAHFEGVSVDFVHADVAALPLRSNLKVDTVVMNPPFGTRKKGIDIQFLEAGLRVRTAANSSDPT
jgi:rRNA N6-adenosine-methyltransferase METTL5